MKKNPEDQLMKEAIARAYPLPEGYLPRVRGLISQLNTQKEERMKPRRLTFVAAFAALMILFTGAFALSQWGVMDFLFPDAAREDLDPLTQKVGIQTTADQVQLTIDSAFYDGETFAMDWTIQNIQPQEPVFVQVEAFTIGGEKVFTDGNDSFDGMWLPGIFSEEGKRQDGEQISLPLSRLQGEKAQVRMEIGLYRSVKPMFFLPVSEESLTSEQQDVQRQKLAELAKEKIQEGFLVLWEDLFAIPDAESDNGIAFALGDIRNLVPEQDLTKQTMELAFDLDLAGARRGIRVLHPQEEYVFDRMTTRYTKAVQTPAGIYLQMEIKPRKGQEEDFEALMEAGEWQLTDGTGKAFEVWPLKYQVHGLDFPDGSFGRFAQIALPIKQEEAPDTVSLSFLPQHGQPLISPVAIK